MCLDHFTSILCRYGCVLPQYLANEQSDFYGEGKYCWMITRCGPDYPNDKNRDLCENPGLDGTPESLVPITDPQSHVRYRNIYCYYCNRVGIEASLIYWTLWHIMELLLHVCRPAFHVPPL